MTEIPRGTQFVGQADARKSSEAPKPREFPVSPEQQRLADALEKNTAVLEKTITAAREKAGDQLKKLTGREMVAVGWQQFKTGMVENVKHQVVSMVKGGVLGAGGGPLSHVVYPELMHASSAKQAARGGALIGAGVGSIWGWESGWRSYNKVAKQEGLPETKWFDWALSNVFVANIAVRQPVGRLKIGAALLAVELFNPNTFGALRTMATGIAKMASGK